MMRGDGSGREPPPSSPDSALWRASRTMDAPNDEAERFLDLAGFADGRLDPDDNARVAEWLQRDPNAAADADAARTLLAVGDIEVAPETLVARALALVGGGVVEDATIVPFPVRRRAPVAPLRRMAGWGSLVAAMAVASWLGFTLGTDTGTSFARAEQPGDSSFLTELLDPAAGFTPGDTQT